MLKEMTGNASASAQLPEPPASAAQPAPNSQFRWTMELAGQNGLHVGGLGKAAGAADHGILRMTVSTEASTASEARAANGRVTRQVAQALRDAGISDEDLNTTGFSIRPTYESVEEYLCPDGTTHQFPKQSDCRRHWKQVLTGYAVSNTLVAATGAVDHLAQMIDAASAAGQDDLRINSVTLAIRDNTALRNQAMAAALADMKDKAALMARESGVALGELLNVSESPGSFSPARELERTAIISSPGIAVASSGTPATEILSGELEVTVRVAGTYRITPSAQ